MTRFDITVAIALVIALAGISPVLAGRGKDPDKIVARILDKLDRDRDGRISQAEAEAGPRLKPHFAEVDADKDGYLSKEELRAALAKLR
jgi:Ca2+-binding EF-hand superfamily protein